MHLQKYSTIKLSLEIGATHFFCLFFFLHKYVERPLQAKALGADLTHNTRDS